MKTVRLFNSHSFIVAARAASALFIATVAVPMAQAATNYWDGNDSAAGFGTAGGTWAAPTLGTTTNGWSTDSTGVTVVNGNSVTTTTNDSLYFGTDTDGLSSGTITISGPVSAGSLYFGKASGLLTFNGGSIELTGGDIKAASASGSTTATNTVFNCDIIKNGGTISIGRQNTAAENYTFNGTISGTAGLDLRPQNNGAFVALNGTNTFSGNVALVTGQMNVNSVADAGLVCALGTGTKITLAGGAGQNPTFWYTGTSAGSMNRTIILNGGNDRITSQDAPLTLSGGISGNTSTYQSSITLSGDAGGGANYNEISGAVSSNANIQVASYAPLGGSAEDGVWKLSGNNSYTGATTVANSSTLIIAHGNALGLTNSGTTVNNNGQLLLMGGIAVGDEALTLNSTGTASWNGETGASLRNYSGNNSWAGNVTLSNSSAIAANSGTTGTLSGVISGTGATTLTKTGGGTLILTGNNNAAIPYVVNGGALSFIFTPVASLIEGFSGGGMTINNGSTVQFSDTGTDTRVSFNGGQQVIFGATGGSTMDFVTGNYLMQGTITYATLGGARNLILSSSNGYFNLQNSGNTVFNVAPGTDLSGVDLVVGLTISSGSITKSGAGTLVLTNSANNLTSGGGQSITINAGVLEIAGSGRLQSGNFVGNITNNATFVYNSTAAQTLSGIISGAGSLTKSNTSTLTLSGINIYTGPTTINAGTLALSSAGTIASSVIDIQNSATFDVSTTTAGNFALAGGRSLANRGTFTGGLIIQSGANVSGGGSFNGSVTNLSGGTLTPGVGGDTNFFPSLTLAGGSTNSFWIGNAAHDMSVVSNSLDYTGSGMPQLTLDLSTYTWNQGDQFVLYNNMFAGMSAFDGTNQYFQITDAFGAVSNLFNNTLFSAVTGGGTATNLFSLRYDFANGGGANNDIMLTAIPEPASINLLVMLGAAYWMRRHLHGRRRRWEV